MTLRASLIAAACGVLWAGAGAVTAQDPPPPPPPAEDVIVQEDNDQWSAEIEDRRRQEAENMDRDRRRGEAQQRDMDAAEELAAAMDKEVIRRFEQEQADRRAAEQIQRDSADLLADLTTDEEKEERRNRCIAALPAQERAAVDMIIRQYAGFERDIRASGGPNVGEALRELNRGRNGGLDALLEGRCR
ncbi:MAG: hypothetical protein EON89_05705 [Brevundimonas sp.]|nr:MAG: hypothetical protein EON89_05705 [Brevundimonas sp.]